MTPRTLTVDCESCESLFSMDYHTEETSEEYPLNCPFCGEAIELSDISEEYIEDDDSDSDDDEWNED